MLCRSREGDGVDEMRRVDIVLKCSWQHDDEGGREGEKYRTDG